MSGIDKKSITFLKNITKNNNREWFQKNKPKYEEAKADIQSFIDSLENEMNKHDLIEGHKLFRIYRDVRFSKDKTPYKTNFALSFKRGTAKLRGGCYVQIEPNCAYVAGGFWNPNPADLKRIRQEIEMDDKPLRKIIGSAKFKNFFGSLEGVEVKTAPKGFDKNHAAIDLIRKKQFLVSRKIPISVVTSDKFVKEVNNTFKAMRPFFNYMSEVLTTDINGTPLY